MKKLEANNIEFEFHHPTASAIFKRCTYQSLSRPSQSHLFPFDQKQRCTWRDNVTCWISIFSITLLYSQNVTNPTYRRESLSFTYAANGQTSEYFSWEFLKIENYQIKTAQKILTDFLCETTGLCVKIMISRRQANGKLGHVVEIRVCRLT